MNQKSAEKDQLCLCTTQPFRKSQLFSKSERPTQSKDPQTRLRKKIYPLTFSRLGFAAEQCPRYIIPSRVDDPTGLSGSCNLFDITDSDHFYRQVVAFLQKAFFKYILVNPKDRQIVLVESVLCPTNIRETFARALFCHFEVNSVFHVPLHLASLCTLAVETALVVDLGFRETIVMPVFSGVQVVKAWQAQPLAAEAVHDEIKGKLIMDGIKEELLTEKVVEDIKGELGFFLS